MALRKIWEIVKISGVRFDLTKCRNASELLLADASAVARGAWPGELAEQQSRGGNDGNTNWIGDVGRNVEAGERDNETRERRF
jgi:hypothetical protein